MLHRNEYYTCDRCKEKIKDVPRHLEYMNICYRKPIKINTRTDEPFVEPSVYATEESEAFRVGTMEMIVTYGTRTKEYDLCPKCRKDFERFMRNELKR